MPLCVQRLYIYSDGDMMIPADHVEAFAAVRQAAGAQVTHCKLAGSMHVSHMRKHPEAYTKAVAEFLEQHPKVETVCYPGLASFPQKALADKQHRDG